MDPKDMAGPPGRVESETVEDVQIVPHPLIQQVTLAEQPREAYGKTGFAGILSQKYVTICAASATLGGCLFGYDQGVVSITLVMDRFIEHFPEIADDHPQGSFNKGIMTALLQLGAFIGALNQGWISDKFSRRWTIFGASIVFLLGSALQTGAMDFPMLVGGRFVGGMIPAVFLGGGVYFLPYSPRWLASKSRDDEALQVLSEVRQLPATDNRVLREWVEIRSEVQFQKEMSMEKHPKLHDGSRSGRAKLHAMRYIDCFRKGAWKRTHVAVGLMFFQQFGGVNALIYYSPTLFKTMGLNFQMQLDMSGVLNIIQMVACFMSLWAMDKYGRRPLLIFGGVCMTLSHLVVSIIVGLYEDSWETHTAQGWVSVAAILFFMLTYGGTWGPIPWALPAEIFPSSLRAIGVGYASTSNWFNNFVIGLITPPMIQHTGFGTYVFFCVFCLLATIWAYFVVPETKGRVLEEMDAVFGDHSGEEELNIRHRIEGELSARVWSSDRKNGSSSEQV